MGTLTPLAWDTETFLIADDEPVPKMVCLSYALGGESGVLTPEDGVGLMRTVLADPEIEIVGHNLPFDWQTLIREDPEIESLIWDAYDAGRVYDTMVAAWLDDIARGCYQGSRKGAYTLAALAARYLGAHLTKEDTWRLRYSELAGIPIESWPHEARDYAETDATTTLAVRAAIHTVGTGDAPDLRRQCAHHWWLTLVGDHGILTDGERVAALFEYIVSEAGEIVTRLLPLGYVSYDRHGEMHRHPGIVQKHLVTLGLADKKTPKGGVSVDAEACERSGDPNLAAYAKLSRLLDAVAKDSEYLGRSVVRCRYGLAESGRSTSWGPNIQNLKTEVFAR